MTRGPENQSAGRFFNPERKTDMNKITQRMLKRILTGLVVGLNAVGADGMSAPGHLAGEEGLGGILDLLGTPPAQGGIGDMPVEKAKSITSWMDNPSTRIGQTQNHMAGDEILSPSNHRAQRHNPEKVGRVFSGNGTVDKASRNVARVHKIQDVVTGRAPTDGHPITPAMKKEATAILTGVRETGRLPPASKLPVWVDKSGVPAYYLPGPFPRPFPSPFPPKKIPLSSKVAGPVVVTIATTFEVCKTEQEFAQGRLTEAQRDAQHTVTGISTATGLAGAAGGAAIGTLILPGPGTVIGGIIGGLVGQGGTMVVADPIAADWARAKDAERAEMDDLWISAYGGSPDEQEKH
jgi:hypothetical protein